MDSNISNMGMSWDETQDIDFFLFIFLCGNNICQFLSSRCVNLFKVHHAQQSCLVCAASLFYNL